jgi:4-amino-4-deoxy-L-arabinose transferase-like glycosyltransferase
MSNGRRMAALVIGCGLLLYLPCAGSYGLWDPWETHYGEVARQMTSRGDFISLWWPGSSREGAVFQSKPVLSFWLMSLGMKVAGLGRAGADPAEMALGHRAEWVARTPFCILAALGLWGLYLVGARLAGRRAGLLAALVAATCPFYALVARQAMTDFAFLGPMILALALAVMAIYPEPGPPGDGVVDDDPVLPRRGRGWWSWPHHPLFYASIALLLVAVVPQLVVDSLDLRVRLPWRRQQVTMYGAVAMLPYDIGVLIFLAASARVRRRAPLLLSLAGTLCGLAVLGKGLAGVALPALVFLAFLAVTGTWRVVLARRLLLPLLLALLAAALVAVPWHHAMIIRHGWPWWNELFGDNHWRRMVMGRHGDRGTFEYFLRELGYGMLPWVALLPAALAAAVSRGTDPRRRVLACLGAIWAVVSYGVVSLSMTKFHHYVLPAVPGLALVLASALDGWWAGRRRGLLVVALCGVPLLLLVLLDLTATRSATQRFLWLFSYDYVHNPAGRAWPAALDFRPVMIAAGVAFAAAAVALAWPRTRRAAVLGLGGAALLFTLFLIDGFMPRVAPYWSQKGTIAAYFQQRRSPAERLVAYEMFWRGETFYTENAINQGPVEERTIFDSDDIETADRGLRAWIERHRGQRHFFLFLPGHRAHLESVLPPETRPTLTVVPQPNDKFVLARADL